MRPHLALLVLRTTDLEGTKGLYESLGLEFGREQHETGPEHWSTTLECGTVIELYPTSVQPQGAQPRLGFVVNDLALTRDAFLTAGGSVVTDDGAVVVVEDLDGRRIELTGS